ncbi:MAG: hypothetical protein WCC89_06800 [Candidatus Sulfotelmatobacter sp.]
MFHRTVVSNFLAEARKPKPEARFQEPEMESLTRLVTDSLVRHGFDRPIDPRRLQWSRWFRCDSPHSLLVVPSKPGIFALAEEVANLGPINTDVGTTGHVGTAAPGCPAEQSSAVASTTSTPAGTATRPLGGAALQRCDSLPLKDAASAAEPPVRRMLAILQFSEDDDMAFTLDRMFTRINPMRDRLASGLCFLRFVVIEDQTQRRSICTALNHWILSSAEKASGLSADFQSSLEFTADRVATTARVGTDAFGSLPRAESRGPASEASASRVGRTLLSGSAVSIPSPARATQPGRETDSAPAPPHPDSGADKNLHCPHPLPSGF